VTLFPLFLLVILTGIPIAFAFGVAALLFMTFASGPSLKFDSLVTVAFSGLDSFVLMSIPFFVFAGDLMKQGGIVGRLIDFSALFMRKGRGGLGGIAVLASTFFGAISGSSAASVAAIGSSMLPEMERQGYRRQDAAALVAASGYIGILIPPSIPLILYGLASSASIGDLFLAGIIPGLLATVMFVGLNSWIVRNSGDQTAVQAATKIHHGHLRTGLSAIPGLLLPIIILGGIYSGIFTPTEAAAVAVAYAIFVGLFVYRSFTLRDIPAIALDSAITSACIMLIIGFSAFFGRVMTIGQVPAAISSAMLGITSDPIGLILLINAFLLFLGMFVETATIIMIATPILLPLVKSLGIDPVHFGVIMVVNLSVGLITPPMALNLFVASRVSGVHLKDLMRPVVPYVIASIGLVLIVTFVPQLSTMLPSMFGK